MAGSGMAPIRIDLQLVLECEVLNAGLDLGSSVRRFHPACDALAQSVSRGFEYDTAAARGSTLGALLGELRAQVAARAITTAADAVDSLNARAVLRFALSARSLLESAAFAAHYASQLRVSSAA